MKKVLKRGLKIWCWYISLTWIFNGTSRSALNAVDYAIRKDNGEIGEGETLKLEWAWCETFRNFKEIYNLIIGGEK